MKLGFSTNAFTEKSLIYAIKSIADTGYDGIEIVLDVPHLFLPVKKSDVETIKNEIKENRLEVTNLNSNTVSGWYKQNHVIEKFEPSLSNEDEKLRRWRIDFTKNVIDLAVEICSPSICITSGVANNSNTGKKMTNLEKSIIEISEYAEKKNISIALEYEPGLLLENFNDTLSLISKDYANLGLNLDVCHSTVLRENIPAIINRIGKKLFHTHISDCKNSKHYHLIPGLGDIDFKSIIKALREINYDGFLTAELYTYSNIPEDAAKRTITYLRRLVS